MGGVGLELCDVGRWCGRCWWFRVGSWVRMVEAVLGEVVVLLVGDVLAVTVLVAGLTFGAGMEGLVVDRKSEWVRATGPGAGGPR